MNHEVLKQLIYEQHEIIKNSLIVPRDCEIDERDNRILVGLRRAGKTTMLYQFVNKLINENGIKWEQIIYLNFEDERFDDFSITDFNDIVEVQSELSDDEGWFFFDEIQNIKGWEKFCRRLSDAKKHVYITGSNSKMLSREMESTLGARYMSSLIYPYSFKEFLIANQVGYEEKDILLSHTSAMIKNAFNTFLQYGGFPGCIGRKNKREYVSSIYQKVIEGDIISRHEIRNPNALRLIIKKLAESVKDNISYTRIRDIINSIGITPTTATIIDYMSYAEEAYLIFQIKNYYSKFSEKEGIPKNYFADTGILSLFLPQSDTSILENAVAAALYQKYQDRVFFIKSSKTGLDIDFFIPEEKTLIQVAYSLNDSSKKREVESLKKAHRHIPEAKSFIILTYAESETIVLDDFTIVIKPVWRWLLEN